MAPVRDLQAEGMARWRQALAPWFGEFARGVPLRGLWFSLPLQRVDVEHEHVWPPTPAWQGIVDDKRPHARRLGWPATRIGYACALVLALVWAPGCCCPAPATGRRSSRRAAR
ncbi:hypothetical protein QNM99_09960 [Pseudomonas sp. PCH446]